MPVKRIAAIVTWYRHRSHADVILGKFLRGFPCDDGLHAPRVEVASIYLDQIPEDDEGRAIAAEFGVPIYDSIPAALTLGGKDLAVDGVLIVGEHGDYAWDEMDRHLYPRRYFFEQAAAVMARSGRVVPLFSDKHLSYNRPDAHWMVERARALGMPLMAGSSLPVAWRRPWLEIPLGARVEAAVSIGYAGLESYGFHALEALQCMVERRAGYETGVAAVQCLKGGDVWAWLAAHPAHDRLARAAGEAIRATEGPWERVRDLVQEPAAYIAHYRDGLETATLMLNGFCRSFSFAAMVEGQARACEVVLQDGEPHGHFSYLCRNIEEMFVTGVPSYPVERTLLTTGVLEAAMESRHRGHLRLATPDLAISYTPVAREPYRPLGEEPAGATLTPWPPQKK